MRSAQDKKFEGEEMEGEQAVTYGLKTLLDIEMG